VTGLGRWLQTLSSSRLARLRFLLAAFAWLLAAVFLAAAVHFLRFTLWNFPHHLRAFTARLASPDPWLSFLWALPALGVLAGQRSPARFLAAAGGGFLLLLSLHAAGVPLGTWATFLAAGVPLLAAWRPPARPGDGRVWAGLIFLWVYLLVLQAGRGPAGGDEVTFWHSASELLRGEGWSVYRASHPSSSYDPAYPVLASLAGALAPERAFPWILKALPPLLGLSLLVLAAGPRPGRAPLFTAGTLFLLFFADAKLRTHFFTYWTGEPLAMLCVVSLFLVFDGRPGPALLAGLGAAAALSKPPLSMLLPVFLAGAWAAGGFRRRARTFAPLLAGTAAAELAWRLSSARAPSASFFSLGWRDLANFDASIVLGKMLPHLLSAHGPLVGASLLTAAMAFLWRRRFRPQLAFAGLMLLSIAVLFCVWAPHNRDYQSGSRYMTQALVGWTVYFLHVKGGLLRRLWVRAGGIGGVFWGRSGRRRGAPTGAAPRPASPGAPPA
jgi:hypothetical protein